MVDQLVTEFDAHVEAVRIGTAAALDRKAAASWRSQRGKHKAKRRRTKAQGLSGGALEQAVMQIAMRDPGMVAMPGEEPRRMRAKD